MDLREELPPSPDSAALAGRAMFRDLVGTMPGAWMAEGEGADAVVTGMAATWGNGVWATRREVAPRTLETLLGRVAETGLPRCLSLRGGTAPEVARIAASHGMTLEAEEPVMVLEDDSTLRPAVARVEDLTIRRLEPDEGALHARVAAAAFGVPQQAFEMMTSPAVLSIPGRHCYVGEVEGAAVATVSGVTLAGTTAVFSVATLPEQRGRGFGSALTAHAVLDGLAHGAAWAWLESSAEGQRVYDRLGFRSVDVRAIWVTIDEDQAP